VSANPDLFEALRPAAYAFTRRVARDTRSPVDPIALGSFLDETVARYRESGGVSDLTEGTVRDVKASVIRFCTERLKVRRFSASNTNLCDAVRPLARERAKALRRTRRGPVDRDVLRAGIEADIAAFRAQPGQAHDDDDHGGLADRLVDFYGRMKPVAPETLKHNGTALGRASLDFAVWSVLHGDETQVEDLSVEAVKARVAGLRTRYARQRDAEGHLSIAPVTVPHGAVRGALQRLRGQPEREATIDALPPTARDLVHVVETEGLPGKRISVVSLAALAGKLWAPSSNPAALRQHRRRLREAAAAIEDAGIGQHVEVLAEHVVVARQRRMPVDPAAVVATALNKGKVRPLSRGLMHRRQGPWGSEEGQDAQATCRVIASHGGDADMNRVLTVTGHQDAVPAFMAVSALYTSRQSRDTSWWVATVQGRQSGDLAFLSAGGDPAVVAGAAFVSGLVSTAREYDLGQAWSDVAATDAYRQRLSGAAAAPARRRVMHIASVLCTGKNPAAWEAAVLADVVSHRPGRRHVATPVPAPIPSLPMPEAEPMPAATTPPPAETFYPKPYKDLPVSAEMLDEIFSHRSVSRMPGALRLVRLIYTATPEDSDVREIDMPWPTTVEGAKAGIAALRTALRQPGMEILFELDEELQHIVKGSLHSAATVLDTYQDARSVAYANRVVATVLSHAGSAERVPGLWGALVNVGNELAWHLAQEAKTATAA